jgi:hypothetical protein
VYVATVAGDVVETTNFAGMSVLTVVGGNGGFVLWKNNEKQFASDEPPFLGEVAPRILVSGEDVYVLRKDNDEIVYWKNGQRQDALVKNKYSDYTSIAVSGDDVYVLGVVEMQSKLWKNGVEQTLQPGSPFRSQ